MAINDPVPTVRNFQDAFRPVRRTKEAAESEYQRAYSRVTSEQREARRALDREFRDEYQQAENEFYAKRRELEEVLRNKQREINARLTEATKPLDEQRDEMLKGAAETRDAAIAQATADYTALFGEETKPLAWLVENYYENYASEVTDAITYCREHASELDNGKTMLDLLDAAHARHGWCGVWSGETDGARARMIKEGIVKEKNPARKNLERKMIAQGWRERDVRQWLDAFDREVTERIVMADVQVPDTAQQAEAAPVSDASAGTPDVLTILAA